MPGSNGHGAVVGNMVINAGEDAGAPSGALRGSYTFHPPSSSLVTAFIGLSWHEEASRSLHLFYISILNADT